jgi:1-pyrroline-5-carboxylate dehydrogenase
MLAEFRNEPLTDFSDLKNREAMQRALAAIRARFGKTHPLVLGGERIACAGTFVSTNPSNPSEVVGHFAKATEAEAQKAIDAALAAFPAWAHLPAEERGTVLLRAARILREKKHLMSALMVLEAGKSWVEADADTAEAIDFMDFYGREAMRYGGPQPLTALPGEMNELAYIPIGVIAVIPPWNFPCAILTGMTTAAMAAGNTVVLKPASDTPMIGQLVFEILEEAGTPPGVVNFLTGPGRIAGDFLVRHKDVRAIAFTGSMEVGLEINRKAAEMARGQIWVKRTILEMGGKDCMVIDETADLAAAARDIVASAFGYQGQKCSAGSRAIIVDKVYDEVLAKSVALTKELVIGPTDVFENKIGPVISASAEKTIMRYIEIGSREGRILAGGSKAPGAGFFIQPTLVADVDRNAVVAQEEIFGPVVAFIRAKDWKDAIDAANGTIYGLTGAFCSNVRERIAYAKRHFHVGNLYFNRKCTGALVGAHPFGGFNMSGTDSKAGGRDYLALFSQAKLWSEKL